MAYLEKLIINGKSYDLADRQLREAQEEIKTAGEKLAEDISLLQTAQEGLQAADERQQEEISLLQESLDAMKITDTAAGEKLHLPDSVADTLQGLKVYVSASQAGEGEPSVTNIRPISPVPATVTVGVADNAEMDGAVRYESCQLPENMYGGYFDWGRGVFVQTHAHVVLDESVPLVYIHKNTTGGYYVGGMIPSQMQSPASSSDLHSTGMCDSLAYGKSVAGRAVYCALTNVWFKGMTECETTEEFKGFLSEHPVFIVYPLQTPIEHAIENAPALNIKTLYPESFLNTTGDSLEATYVVSPKAYIDKKIQEAVNENL